MGLLFYFFFGAMIRLSPVGSNESTWPRSEPKHYKFRIGYGIRKIVLPISFQSVFVNLTIEDVSVVVCIALC